MPVKWKKRVWENQVIHTPKDGTTIEYIVAATGRSDNPFAIYWARVGVSSIHSIGFAKTNAEAGRELRKFHTKVVRHGMLG